MRVNDLALAAALLVSAGLFTGCGSVSEQPPPTLSLTITPPRIPAGGSATLQWQASSAATCTASGGWNGQRAPSGSESLHGLDATTDFTLRCTGPGGTTHAVTRVGVGTADSSSAFPLRVEPGRRYLIDALGRPFLIQGDAAWSLLVELTDEEVDRYLEDRLTRGFNTLLVNLIEHAFTRNPPKNVFGQPPFLTPGDFSATNESYFAHVDRVLERASQKGFLVLLVPSYLGYMGGDDGWYAEMLLNGPERLREYGRFLGRRYKDHVNLLWTHGGDYNPPERFTVRAIADGIREFDTRALGTAHCAPETAAADYWDNEPWLKVNNVYSTTSVLKRSLKQYQRPDRMPFFLLEGIYENEHNVTVQYLRLQAYHALLAGASGQVFGNSPIWHFSGPGLYPVQMKWERALGSPGSESMSHLWNLFSPRAWWRLVPDTSRSMVKSFDWWLETKHYIRKALNRAIPEDRAIAARSDDGAFMITYLPAMQKVTVDLGQMAGPKVAATWFDPTAGTHTSVAGSPFAASGEKTFTPGHRNRANDGDWVLLLESVQ